jgi:hypothetical protein
MAKAAHPDEFCAWQYTPHVMRHTTASHLVEVGVPLAIVKNILGRASIQSTQIYVEITQQTVDKYMKEWNEKWFPKEEVKEGMLPTSKARYQHFCSKELCLLFEKIYREAPFAGLLGVSSNNGFPRINTPGRAEQWLR